jgi:ribosome-binding protein aMBF1 (putative translation factor)
MIRNERQYRITQARAEDFRRSLAQSEQERGSSRLHPRLQRAQTDALRSQLKTLEGELTEYEELKSGRQKVLTYNSFDELPKALVQARIARGWTQKELADRLGLDEQKIQDYEATDYQRASFARIREVVRALEIEIREEVRLYPLFSSTSSNR